MPMFDDTKALLETGHGVVSKTIVGYTVSLNKLAEIIRDFLCLSRDDVKDIIHLLKQIG